MKINSKKKKRKEIAYPKFVVQSLSCIQLFVTPHAAACQASLSFTVSLNLLKFMSTCAIPPSYPMLSLSPPPLNLSQHWGFSSKLILHIRWTYWSFSFSISPSNEYSGLISFSCLVGSPCSPRDSQEYSPAQQFESINSSAFTFIYSPTLNIHT